jgi:hypothetical protein
MFEYSIDSYFLSGTAEKGFVTSSFGGVQDAADIVMSVTSVMERRAAHRPVRDAGRCGVKRVAPPGSHDGSSLPFCDGRLKTGPGFMGVSSSESIFMYLPTASEGRQLSVDFREAGGFFA